MTPQACITTSWDDGHPADLRLAELLAKYSISATFYVPRASDKPTLSAAELQTLSQSHDVGAHTMQHVTLTSLDDNAAAREITGSKKWIEDITARPCTVFCPPLGYYRRSHLTLIREAGFTGARTVELLSLDPPRLIDGLRILPTTLQAWPQSPIRYVRNIAKRGALRNLWLWLARGRSASWTTLASRLLAHISTHGGVFHLWGHSWEIEQADLWQPLEDVLALLAAAPEQIARLDNSALCQPARPLAGV